MNKQFFKIKNKGDEKFICNKCEKEFNIWEAGYIGPEDREDESCNPFVKFVYICEHCEFPEDGCEFEDI
jgi:hypothetical protein